MLSCICTPSVVEHYYTDRPSSESLQQLPEPHNSTSWRAAPSSIASGQQQQQQQLKIAACSGSSGAAATGDCAAEIMHTVYASSEGAGSIRHGLAAWSVQSSSSSGSSSSSSLGAADMLAGSSSPASGSGLGFDCSVLASPSAAVELENGCSSGSSSGGHMLAAQQRRRSLYAATSGDYNRLLQQQQQWPGPSSTLHHSVSTPSIPRGMRRSSNSSSGSGSSTKARRAATTLAAAAASEQQQGKQHGQQQQQPANGRPLTRSWSWPWGLSSCTAPSCSCSTEYEGEVPAAAAAAAVVSRRTGSSSRLLSEAGLAAVAGVAALHPAVQAYLQGSLGIAFSGGGFRYTYFVGVMDVLVHHLGIVGPETLLSGASCGALIAVFTKCGLPVEKVLELTNRFSHDCATNGVKGRLGIVLRAYLEAYLPDDAHSLCDGNTFLAVTKVWPTIRTRLFSSFPTRADLISAVMASCHLPTLSDGTFTVNFKGRLHIDGGLLSVISAPPDALHSVLVCSMPSRQIAKLPAFIGRPKQCDISISPDTYQSWPFSRSETTGLALEPPSPEFISHMVARGRADAWSWAEEVGLVRNGVPVFPIATRVHELRNQVFGQPAGGLLNKAKAATAAAPATHSITSSSKASWELFVGSVVQEGALRHKQLLQHCAEERTADCGIAAALELEANTAPAAEAAAATAAAHVAAAAAAAAAGKAGPGKTPSAGAVATAVAPHLLLAGGGSSSSRPAVGNSSELTSAVFAAGSCKEFPAAPQSVGGSSDGMPGSSGDWQFLVTELGVDDDVEAIVASCRAAAAPGGDVAAGAGRSGAVDAVSTSVPLTKPAEAYAALKSPQPSVAVAAFEA